MNDVDGIGLPSLQSIHFDDYAFYSASSFALNRLSSLQFIEIGVRCFYNASSFSLTSLTDF